MNPICTVLLISYNHSKYITKAIESVLAQKTKYNFIIKIFDDASTDGTQEIIKAYAEKYPQKIIPYLNKENMGAQGNIWRAYESVDTKYCILTETDDYWCNENKLQMQIDAMEKHSECSFCSTNNYIEVIKDNYLTFLNNQIQIKPEIYGKNGIIDYNHISNIPAGFMTHPSARLVRTEAIDIKSIKYREAFLFDDSQYFYLLDKGPMYWISEPTSVYVKTGEGNWTSQSASSRMNQYWQAMLEVNMQTEGRRFIKIAHQLAVVTNWWIALEQRQHQPQNTNKVVKKESKLKKLKHYIFSPLFLDLFNLPRDIIRYLKKKRGK